MDSNIPECVYCRAKGLSHQAVMMFEMPIQRGEINYGDVPVALCNDHFEELRDTLNRVWDNAHRPKRKIVIPPGIHLN